MLISMKYKRDKKNQSGYWVPSDVNGNYCEKTIKLLYDLGMSPDIKGFYRLENLVEIATQNGHAVVFHKQD